MIKKFCKHDLKSSKKKKKRVSKKYRKNKNKKTTQINPMKREKSMDTLNENAETKVAVAVDVSIGIDAIPSRARNGSVNVDGTIDFIQPITPKDEEKKMDVIKEMNTLHPQESYELDIPQFS